MCATVQKGPIVSQQACWKRSCIAEHIIESGANDGEERICDGRMCGDGHLKEMGTVEKAFDEWGSGDVLREAQTG